MACRGGGRGSTGNTKCEARRRPQVRGSDGGQKAVDLSCGSKCFFSLPPSSLSPVPPVH